MRMSQDARLDEEQATARRAQLLGLAYIDASQISNKQLFKEILANPELDSLRAIPIRSDAHNITFGVTNTTSQQTMASLRQRFADQQVNFALISDASFREYIKLYNPPKKVVYEEIQINSAGSDDLITKVSATLDQVRADDMLAYLVQQAHRLKASDIHFENQKEFVRIRFRIDGVLHPVARLSREKSHMLISAIASAGNISTSANEAQQGHIVQKVHMADGGEVDINLRVETVPAINGMDIVMRLFNLDKTMFTLDKLGLSDKERELVQSIINKPSGLLLAVGPTGSGKTTTLYSVLNSLNNQERKIITIEDPVEYQFDGITQISINPKTTGQADFAEKLRSVLRLDPDVVMVGEIRDMDTARTALQASLTGHLVLSTFHAGSASAALTRLMNIIGENPLFISAIRLIMAQRLVRRLDDTLKQPYTPDQQTIGIIKQVLDTLPTGVDKPSLENLQLYKPGTSTENPYGFSGQIALREQFIMAGEVDSLLRQAGKSISTEEIEAAAIKSGMTTMLQDGVLKMIKGLTSFEEVYRVVG